VGLSGLAAPVSEFTALYQAARFGGARADRQRLKDLLERIQSAGRTRPARVTTLIL
jgi:hypothetical protein